MPFPIMELCRAPIMLPDDPALKWPLTFVCDICKNVSPPRNNQNVLGLEEFKSEMLSKDESLEHQIGLEKFGRKIPLVYNPDMSKVDAAKFYKFDLFSDDGLAAYNTLASDLDSKCFWTIELGERSGSILNTIVPRETSEHGLEILIAKALKSWPEIKNMDRWFQYRFQDRGSV